MGNQGPAEHEIEARNTRKQYMLSIVKQHPGLTRTEAKGKFTKRFSVRKTTFYSYIEDLIDEERIVEQDHFGAPGTLWTPEQWAAERERQKQLEIVAEERRVNYITLDAFDLEKGP